MPWHQLLEAHGHDEHDGEQLEGAGRAEQLDGETADEDARHLGDVLPDALEGDARDEALGEVPRDGTIARKAGAVTAIAEPMPKARSASAGCWDHLGMHEHTGRAQRRQRRRAHHDYAAPVVTIGDTLAGKDSSVIGRPTARPM